MTITSTPVAQLPTIPPGPPVAPFIVLVNPTPILRSF
jgi:hypothetical protein